MAKSPSPAPPLPPHWFQILLSLADRDLHGLAIMNDVLERTGGRMRLWPAMLYRNLARLVSEELVSEIDAPPDADPRGGRPQVLSNHRARAPGLRRGGPEAGRVRRRRTAQESDQGLNRVTTRVPGGPRAVCICCQQRGGGGMAQELLQPFSRAASVSARDAKDGLSLPVTSVRTLDEVVATCRGPATLQRGADCSVCAPGAAAGGPGDRRCSRHVDLASHAGELGVRMALGAQTPTSICCAWCCARA